YSCNNTLMVHIRNLRKKIETGPDAIIKTVWGKGYRID
ncbi:MAG: winged helix-turn-helix domain-containing protein, partial [Clostridia bacterium]|nr:winged helix-turn-helix domain-containing protein [Clostridia bacterium]